MSLTLDSAVGDFIAYVEKKNLYNSFNKMLIHCDNTLKELLGVDSFAFFGLERILKQQKEKQMEEPKQETILADDSLTLEEVAAQILAKLHELPMDLSGTVIQNTNDTESESETPSTPDTAEYEEESQDQQEENNYEGYDEFHVSDRNHETVRFASFTKNGIPIINMNGISFEQEDLLEYIKSISKKEEPVVKADQFNEGMIIGILTAFLVATFFSLWLSFVNVSLSKMG